jgi:hypothetical protein
MLLRRPYWKGILAVLAYFALLWFISAPRNSVDFAVCVSCAIGFFFLSDCYREFVFPAVLRVMRWGLFVPMAFFFAIACGLGVDFAGRHFGVPLTLIRPIQFMVALATVGALSAMISNKLRRQEQSS